MRRLNWLFLSGWALATVSGCGQGDAAPVTRQAAAVVPPPTLEPARERPVVAPKSSGSPIRRVEPSPKETVKAADAGKPSEITVETANNAKDATDNKDSKTDKSNRDRRPRGQDGSRDRSSDRGSGGPPKGDSSKAAPSFGGAPPSDGGGFDAGGAGFGGGFGGPARETPKKGYLPDGLPSWFKEYDKDGDGQIALHEWPADKSIDEFNKFDLNGDGFITPEEVLRVLPPPKQVASNGNGAGNGAAAGTTPPAANGAPPAAPATPPANDAGKVASSSPPGSPGAPAAPPNGDSGRARFGGDWSRGMSQTPEERLERMKRTIAQFDKNGDGKLQLDEIPLFWRSIRERFAEFDTNKDGGLDAQELQAAFDSFRRQWSGGR